MIVLRTVTLSLLCIAFLTTALDNGHTTLNDKGNVQNQLIEHNEYKLQKYSPDEGLLPTLSRQAKNIFRRWTSSESTTKTQRKKRSQASQEEEDNEFPWWIFFLLVPLVIVLLLSIGCFIISKHAYDKACKANKQAKNLQSSVEAIRKSAERPRKAGGLPMSAMSTDAQPTSDYCGFEAQEGSRVREGGMGSIMRDPDLDLCTKPEKAQVSRMVFKANTWTTVDKVPSDMSFEIPSDSASNF